MRTFSCVLAIVIAALPALAEFRIEAGDAKEAVAIFDGEQPVLRYEFGATTVPEGVDPAFSRSDYVSRLYSPSGALLTDDYPSDHVHHRGINWSWATIEYKGETRDMFAVRNPYTGPLDGGCWARPIEITRTDAGPDRATIEAKNAWRWDDEETIAEETVAMEVSRANGNGWCVDFIINVVPKVEGVRFAGRLGRTYSGFNVRMAPCKEQKIQYWTEQLEPGQFRSFAAYSGEFSDHAQPSGIAIFQHPDNPDHPQQWIQYPHLNYFQPVYPGGLLVELKPFELKYRVWAFDGRPSAEALRNAWGAYAGDGKG